MNAESVRCFNVCLLALLTITVNGLKALFKSVFGKSIKCSYFTVYIKEKDAYTCCLHIVVDSYLLLLLEHTPSFAYVVLRRIPINASRSLVGLHSMLGIVVD